MIATIDNGRIRALITRWAALIVAAFGLLSAGVANATTVYVSPGMPDISAGSIVWDYGDQYGGGRSASTGPGDYRLFQITSGVPVNYIDPTGVSSQIWGEWTGAALLPATLDLMVGIDSNRGIDAPAVGSSVDGTNHLVIRGRFAAFPFGTPGVSIPVVELLTATISLLKDPTDNPDSLQFVAAVTGGSLAADYGGTGAEFVVFANAAGIGGPWTGSTFVLDSGSADFATEAVPAPGSVALLLLGMAVMRRRLSSRGAGLSAV